MVGWFIGAAMIRKALIGLIYSFIHLLNFGLEMSFVHFKLISSIKQPNRDVEQVGDIGIYGSSLELQTVSPLHKDRFQALHLDEILQ